MAGDWTRSGFTLRAYFTVPKVEGGYVNEDRVAVSRRKDIYAISDGASISFDSASWSRILVKRFAQEPVVSAEFLREAIREFSKIHDRESLPWMAQAALDRGSFATLLGICYHRVGHYARILAIGDSLAALCDGDQIVATFPYTDPADFEQPPELLSTNLDENRFVSQSDFSESHGVKFMLQDYKEPTLLCMTDALGLWVLAHQADARSPIARLRAIRSRRQFARFVIDERKSGRLRRDDTTLLMLW